MSDKPSIEIPDGPAPTELVLEDLRVGDGAEAVAGKTCSMQYVGVAWSTGKQFDASWDRGVAGMKVGGQRRLTIPAELGYGQRGAGRAIGPGETLVFVVDLVDVS